MTIGRFAGAIVSVLLLAIVAIVLITLSQDAAFREDVFSEIVKHLLQLAVVITVGGGIAALFKTFEHARDRAAKARDEALRQAHLRAQTHEDYLKRLGTFYRSVKSSRRRLRASGITPTLRKVDSLTPEQRTAIRREMHKLNGAQLELEGMMLESELLPAFLATRSLARHLHTMEDYLRELLAEYEDWAPGTPAGDKIRPRELEKLHEFVSPVSSSIQGRRFLSSFTEPYGLALGELGKSIASANAP